MPGNFSMYVTRALTASPTAALLLAGLVLPNALFAVGVLAGLEVPYRPGAIIGYFLVALVARHASPRVTIPAFLAVVAFDVVFSLGMLFHFSPPQMALALREARELRLFASPRYVAVAASALAASFATAVLLRHGRAAFARASLPVALACLGSVLACDLAVNSDPSYAFGKLTPGAARLDSAVATSRLLDDLASESRPSRNVLIVLVEGWGTLVDPDRQAIIERPFASRELASRYRIARGSTRFYGSTTSAEMRELCSSREPPDALERSQMRCLPSQLRAAGYDTVAVHGFTRRMFDRHEWYPRVGFARHLFWEELSPALSRTCGLIFEGACDADLVHVVRDQLGVGTAPKFVYWLTLNTHIPIREGDGSGRFACESAGGAFGDVDVCHMAELWSEVFAGVVSLAMDPAVGPMDVLVVGDHAPPFWRRPARRLFRPGEVSWVRLTPLPSRAHTDVAAAHRAERP